MKVSVPSSFDKATKDCIIARIDEDFTIQGRMIRCKKENPSDGDTKEAIDCFKNLKSLVTCFLWRTAAQKEDTNNHDEIFKIIGQ